MCAHVPVPLLTVCARTNHFFARSYWYPDAILVGVVADLEATLPLYTGWPSRLDAKRFWDEMRPTRARDYLPTPAESPWGTWPGAVSLLTVSGHADEFAVFVADVLLPHIDRSYRTLGDASRALIGKSFGGCGVACCMIHPACASRFSEYVMCSPSLSWDEGAWFRIEEERRAAHAEAQPPGPAKDTRASAPHAAAVYCCVGSEESTDAAARLREVLDRRRGGPKVPVRLDVLQGETHGSVSYPFVHRAMDFLKARWQLAGVLLRRATAGDAEQMACVWHDAYYDDPGTVELDASFLAERTLESFRPRAAARILDTVVAVDIRVGGIVGFFTCRGDELEQFYLRREMRGIGLADVLMERAEALLESHGTTRAHLVVCPANRRARRFYERRGWEEVREVEYRVEISAGRTRPLRLIRYEKLLAQDASTCTPPPSPIVRAV